MRKETISYCRKSIFYFIAFFSITAIISSCGGGGGSSSSGGGGGTASTYSISGTVTENNTGLSGVTATLTQGGATAATATTDSSGNYTFSSLANGSYVVTPSKSSYIFSPTSITVTVNGANVTGQNFTAGTGGTATLSWNANTESDLAGYKAYYGTSPKSGSTPATAGYSDTIDMGNVTSYVISNLTSGVTYYFSITAYDTSTNESDLSEEVLKAMP